MTNILVFPCSMPGSITYFQQAKNEGDAVIGVSSLRYDESASLYDRWLYVPYVNDDGFESALIEMVEQHNIAAIYTPHKVIWQVLNKIVSNRHISLIVLPKTLPDNQAEDVSGVIDVMGIYNKMRDGLPQRSQAPFLDEQELKRYIDESFSVPGESGIGKLVTLCMLAVSAPKGDIVEIGSLYGRTAYLFACLSEKYDIGKVLCVDPWTEEGCVQNDAPEMVRSREGKFSIISTFNYFREALPKRFGALVNYYRDTSSAAHAIYGPNAVIETPEFGGTQFTGNISILHIDGNHDYRFVSEDVTLWVPHVVAGGWIIVDDYCWSFGDGPRRAGDELLEEVGDKALSFVVDGALCIKLLH